MWYPLGLLGVVLIFAMVKSKSARASSVPEVEVTQGPGRIVHPDDTEQTSSEDQKETEKFVEEEIKKANVKKLPAVFPVPKFIEAMEVKFDGGKTVVKVVTNEYWTLYVKSVITGGQSTVTPNFNLGLFGLNMRILEDFGYAKNVKKVDYKGRQVWRGDFVNGTLEDFLADGPLQYEVFLKMTMRHFEYIKKKYLTTMYRDSIPIIDNQPATYSGLLAVAKFAGLSGMDKWIKGDRKPATTAAYKKSNNIF